MAEHKETWSELRAWVKDGIGKNADDIVELRKEVIELRIEMKVQQVKAGIFGTIGAAIPSAMVFIILYLKGVFDK